MDDPSGEDRVGWVTDVQDRIAHLDLPSGTDVAVLLGRNPPPGAGQVIRYRLIPAVTTEPGPRGIRMPDDQALWDEFAALPPDNVHVGQVAAVFSKGYAIRLGSVLGAMRLDESTKRLRPGQVLQVVVSEFDPERQRLIVRPLSSKRAGLTPPMPASGIAPSYASLGAFGLGGRTWTAARHHEIGLVMRMPDGVARALKVVQVLTTDGQLGYVSFQEPGPAAGQIIRYAATGALAVPEGGKSLGIQILDNDELWMEFQQRHGPYSERAVSGRSDGLVVGWVVATFAGICAVDVEGVLAAMQYDGGVGDRVAGEVRRFDRATQLLVLDRVDSSRHTAIHRDDPARVPTVPTDRGTEGEEPTGVGASTVSAAAARSTIGGYIRELLDAELEELGDLDEEALDRAEETVHRGIAELLLKLGPPPSASGHGWDAGPGGPGGGSDEGSPVGTGGWGGGRRGR